MNKYYKYCCYNTESLSKVCQKQISSKNEIISDKEIRIEKYKEKLKSDNNLQNMRKMEKLFQISQTNRARLLQAAGYKFHNERFQKTDFEKQDQSGYPQLHHAAMKKQFQIFFKMIQMECQYIKACEATNPSHLSHLRQIIINHFNYLSIMEQIKIQ